MKPIRKVLIANRGEIALRILRTLEHMDIAGVVVYHAVDSDSPAVKKAKEKVEIDGPTPVAAYLNPDAVIAACRTTGADALHPGYGFLAENPVFAKRLAEEGITFIGPLPETIALMGNKIAARSFCMANDFPLAPSITESQSGKDFIKDAARIGVPLLIKAAAGGGGKGMHIVRDLEDLRPAVALAKGEALRAFGDDTVYAERYIENPRHIEVQVLADNFGHIVHLGERECSIQRRFQKIIEESPAPDLPEHLRKRICDTAVEIARRAGYRNAGTVEFLLGPDNTFYFLEMNTRLQVEHPVTEMTTGLDLVELQIRVARQEALTLRQEHIRFHGHAIELRLYAEDPQNDFLPATGQLLVYDLPEGPGIRIDNGFTEKMKVTSAFDPMLAKMIVHGTDRQETIEKAIKALADAAVLGVATNADYLGRICAHPAFGAGIIHTGFIHQYGDDLRNPHISDSQRNLLLVAAALSNRELTDPAFTLPPLYASMGNWRN